MPIAARLTRVIALAVAVAACAAPGVRLRVLGRQAAHPRRARVPLARAQRRRGPGVRATTPAEAAPSRTATAARRCIRCSSSRSWRGPHLAGHADSGVKVTQACSARWPCGSSRSWRGVRPVRAGGCRGVDCRALPAAGVAAVVRVLGVARTSCWRSRTCWCCDAALASSDEPGRRNVRRACRRRRPRWSGGADAACARVLRRRPGAVAAGAQATRLGRRVAAAALLTIAPWTLRNYVTSTAGPS